MTTVEINIIRSVLLIHVEAQTQRVLYYLSGYGLVIIINRIKISFQI